MSTDTINIGVDLGTTNSSIARWHPDGSIEVFKNLEQSESTPSVVHENRKEFLVVGPRARAAAETDSDNVVQAFKKQMGLDWHYTFSRSQRRMSAVELSTEVLKSLKGDVARLTGEEAGASVVTIPAAFDRNAIAATNEAARQAGFSVSPLCLEPVAAALAYEHQRGAEDGFWFVFDLGGGTFDAAVVRLREGSFQLVNHHGNTELGGEDIDRAILDEIIIPAVRTELDWPEFSRESPDPIIKSAILRLKNQVEKAKIQLTSMEKTLLEAERFAMRDGEEMHFDYVLTRSAIERVTEPLVLRCMEYSRKALNEKRLTPQDLDRVILVGGATQMPLIREMLADENVGFGRPVDIDIDPMTAVARGAAIFARTQRAPKTRAAPKVGEVILDLDYEAVSPDEEPVVVGRMSGPASVQGFRIEFVQREWRSGLVPVDENGAFMAMLFAEPGENTYQIVVQDAAGNVVASNPSQLHYLRKSVFKDIPLTHSIGVALANNEQDLVFEKGSPLPVSADRDYKTTLQVVKNDPASALRIPLVEGSSELADRNTLIGALTIASDRIHRTIPAGSSVEFRLSVDESNMLHASAYIPVLDEEYSGAFDLTKPGLSHDNARDEVAQQIARVGDLRERTEFHGTAEAVEALRKLDEQQLLPRLEETAAVLDTDTGATERLVNHLREVKLALDEVQEALVWPELISEIDETRELAERVVQRYGTDADRARLKALLTEFEAAIASEETDLIRRKIEEIDDLRIRILVALPEYWVEQFDSIRSRAHELTDTEVADELFARGVKAIDDGNGEDLQNIVRQLWRLLPDVALRRQQGFDSGVIR